MNQIYRAVGITLMTSGLMLAMKGIWIIAEDQNMRNIREYYKYQLQSAAVRITKMAEKPDEEKEEEIKDLNKTNV